MTVPVGRNDTQQTREAARTLDNLVMAMHDGHYAVAELCKQSLLAALAALEAERDTLAEALRTFGQHPELCSIWVELDDVTGLVHPVGTCNCGLAVALAAGRAGTP